MFYFSHISGISISKRGESLWSVSSPELEVTLFFPPKISELNAVFRFWWDWTLCRKLSPCVLFWNLFSPKFLFDSQKVYIWLLISYYWSQLPKVCSLVSVLSTLISKPKLIFEVIRNLENNFYALIGHILESSTLWKVANLSALWRTSP